MSYSKTLYEGASGGVKNTTTIQFGFEREGPTEEKVNENK